jgi:hypothetical protein
MRFELDRGPTISPETEKLKRGRDEAHRSPVGSPNPLSRRTRPASLPSALF